VSHEPAIRKEGDATSMASINSRFANYRVRAEPRHWLSIVCDNEHRMVTAVLVLHLDPDKVIAG
jgi:hypothetical protein